MTGDVANPRIWQGADMYVVATGTTMPTDIVTALSAPILAGAVGLLGEDGMSEAKGQDVTDYYAWGPGGILVRSVLSKHKRTIKVSLLEDNPVAWAFVNPGSTAATASTITTRQVKTPSIVFKAGLMQLVDDTITKRRIIPRLAVTEWDDETYSENEMTMHGITMTIYPDSNGLLYKDITNDPQAIVP